MEIVSQPQNLISPFLNTREISILIWITVFFIWILTFKSIRESFTDPELFKALFSRVILGILSVMSIYLFFEVFILIRLNLWSDILLKDLFLWIVTTGLALVINKDNTRDLWFFTKVLKDNIKFTLILEFIIQNYTFPLVIEFIFVPALVIIIVLNSYSKTNHKYENFAKFSSYLLAFIGIVDFIYVISSILSDPTSILNRTSLIEFTLPIYLTILFIPFLYLLSIFMRYDSLIGPNGRITTVLKNMNSQNIPYIRKKILVYCNINLRRWNNFNRNYANRLFEVKGIDEINNIFDNIK